MPGWSILALIIGLSDDSEIIYVGYNLFVWQRMCKIGVFKSTVKLSQDKSFQKFYFAIGSWMNFSFPLSEYDEVVCEVIYQFPKLYLQNAVWTQDKQHTLRI